MRVQVILRTEGRLDAVVGESEGESVEDVVANLADRLEEIVKNLREGTAP